MHDSKRVSIVGDNAAAQPVDEGEQSRGEVAADGADIFDGYVERMMEE